MSADRSGGGLSSIDGIFESKSIAVIGASSRKGNLAGRIVRNLVDLEFPGRCYPIGRSDEILFDLPVYRSVLDVPDPIELAVIAVPAAHVPSALDECGRKGIRYATITSSGFGEYGEERRDLELQLLEIAGRYGLRFLGPNCQGIRDFATGLSTRFGKQRKQSEVRPAVGVIVQSGTISSTFERFLKLETIGLTRLASIGNKLNVDETDLLPGYLAHDPTKMVFLYLEGIRQGRRLFEIARGAPKPVILFKGNISPTTATIARSHSASVLNEQRVLEVAARQAGVALVKEFSECQIVAKAHLLPSMKGDNLVIFGGSGGMAVVGADWAHRTGFTLVPLPEDARRGIEDRLPGGYIKIGNPVDLGDFFDMTAILEMIDTTLGVPSVDGMVVCMFDPSPGQEFHNVPDRPFAVEVREIMEKHGKPIALVYAAEKEVIRKASAEAEMPIFAGADEAVRGLEASRNHWRSRARAEERLRDIAIDRSVVREIIDRARAAGTTALGYVDCFALLAAAGLQVEAPRPVASAEEARAVAREMAGPVCMKLLAGDGAHKTETGAVRLGLEDDDAVGAAFAALHKADPAAPISIQRMVAGIELMLGAKRDPHFGPVVSVGLGGTLVELLDDVALRLAPVTRREAEEMLSETRAARLLAGFRGAPAGDGGAVVDALERLARLVAEVPEIAELDVNPLIVRPEGMGIRAVDARILLDFGEAPR